MTSLPLLSRCAPDDVIAWRQGNAVTGARFVADVMQLAAALPRQSHVLNACSDRYRFMVGFSAALMAGKTNLLPPALTPEMVRRLREFAPGTICLTDHPLDIDMPTVFWQTIMSLPASASQQDVPVIPASRAAAVMFTSGSTGLPVSHVKTWGSLVAGAHAEADCLGLTGKDRHYIVATVPAQHMFGLESTMLLVQQGGMTMNAGQPFYPSDICATLAATPEPRILVSTPAHLKVLLASGLQVPPVKFVLSATAPISPQLASETESRLQTQLLEIFGSTETGQIASRRTTQSAEWKLFPGVTLDKPDGRFWARGGHLQIPTPLADELELLGPEQFLLHGRTADLINIAGKRSSLGYLNHQLNAIPGVLDGAFFMPEDIGDGPLARPMAFVVAPDMQPAALQAALRDRIDALFMPRPLVLLKSLPRNSMGKLTHGALLALANEHQQKGLTHAG
ncbi:MAG: AMP-binding protein [Pseudomonadota bacterium]